MLKSTVITLSLLLTILLSVNAAESDTPLTVIEKPGVRYCERDTAKCLLDLYLPAQETASLRPGVLLIHGGGWRAGDRGQWRKLALLLAERGYVCASASYRLYPATDGFGMIADVRSAMEWFKTHAAEYRMDPERIGTVGSSAGGHLVALLATIAPGDSLGDPEHALKFDTRPAAVACYNPVLDFIDENRTEGENKGVMTGRTGDEAMADFKMLSPARRVSAGMPPFLFIYGDKDTVTPVEYCGKMIAGMNALGISTQLEMFKEMEHGFGYSLEPGESLRAAEVTAGFFDEMLKAGK